MACEDQACVRKVVGYISGCFGEGFVRVLELVFVFNMLFCVSRFHCFVIQVLGTTKLMLVPYEIFEQVSSIILFEL